MESHEFEAIGRRGRLTEMADAFTLPRVYPSLRDVDFWVDPEFAWRRRSAGVSLRVCPHSLQSPCGSRDMEWRLRGFWAATKASLRMKSKELAGERSTVVFTGSESFLMAAIPAALAASRLASGACRAGIVPVDQHVGAAGLTDALTRHGIRIR